MKVSEIEEMIDEYRYKRAECRELLDEIEKMIEFLIFVKSVTLKPNPN